MKLVRSDELMRQRGRDTIAHARKCFSENPEAKAKHRSRMVEIGKKIGGTIGVLNLKNYWLGNTEALRKNGTKGAHALNQLINKSPELQAKRKEACIKGNETMRKLWQIPEYAEARKRKDKETCARIVKELRNATS